jgi:hypothetical protein
MRTTVATALAFLVVTGLAAGARVNGAQSVYAAFPLTATSGPKTRRCGSMIVTRGTYTGLATSPDPRLAGRASVTLEIGVNPATGYGYARGPMTIKARSVTRLRGFLTGVVSNRNVINGIVTGTLTGPKALLIGNLSLVFNENFTFAAMRLGVESGQNSAVAYNTPRC